MIIYKLYVKTHRKTGLKYLGQTKKDPHIYLGSGGDWLQHLSRNGNDVQTEILLETPNTGERNFWGRYYSTLWRITTSVDDFGNRIWANRIPETGGGGGNTFMTPESVKKRAMTQTGTKKPETHRKKCSVRMLKEHRDPSSVYNSESIKLKKSKSMKSCRSDKTSVSKFNTAEYHIKIRKSCKTGSAKFRLHYIICNPVGVRYDIIGLVDFCKEHNLNKGAMGAVTRGETTHHKGWTGYKVKLI
jgi:hypothetical protein